MERVLIKRFGVKPNLFCGKYLKEISKNYKGKNIMKIIISPAKKINMDTDSFAYSTVFSYNEKKYE